MRVQPLATYFFLIVILFINSGAGCGRKDETNSQPHHKLLLGGYQELTEILTIRLQIKIVLDFKFYTHGEVDRYTNGPCMSMARWYSEQKDSDTVFGMYLDNPDQKALFGKFVGGLVAIHVRSYSMQLAAQAS